MIAFGSCYGCKDRFEFDVNQVPSVYVDPGTGLPPDVGGTDPENAKREPLCPSCVEKVNEIQAAKGEGPKWGTPPGGERPFGYPV